MALALFVGVMVGTFIAIVWSERATSTAVTANHFASVAERYQPALAPDVPPLPHHVDPVPATPAPANAAAPGDTDLYAVPLAVYAGGPPADRLSVRGLHIGLAAAEVPTTLLSERASDHLIDAGGNLYAVDAGRIAEVHLRDLALLARLPIDGTHALFARFGEPIDIYTGDGEQTPVFIYPDRGIHVRWDTAAERIVEIVLVRPTRRSPN